MKVMVVFGTRPEAIKMCPLILELKKCEEIECCVCLTGQHEEMLNQVMEIFQIEADYNLHIMSKNQTLSEITALILERFEDVLEEEKPDVVLVHGDTSTAFTVALSAFYHRIPIGHVEAGLRTYNMQSPYPEEFNRQVVDLIANLYFAPTEVAKEQLIKEGKLSRDIYITGNTVIDALKTTVQENYYNENLEWASDSKLILMTAHRRENIGKPMEEIFSAIKQIVHDNPDVKVLYPVHKNPRVREIAEKILGDEKNIRLIEPLDVFDFHNFMSRSYLIVTDSGGIQEEAPSLGKPVLVVRDTTERPEGIKGGTLKLIGTKKDIVYKEISRLLMDKDAYLKMSTAQNPYGDGHASERITNIVLERFR